LLTQKCETSIHVDVSGENPRIPQILILLSRIPYSNNEMGMTS